MRLPIQGDAIDLEAVKQARFRRGAPIYVPETPEEIFLFIRDRLDMLQKDFNRRVRFLSVPFTAGTASAVLRPEEPRSYLFVQNTHATQILYVGFGFVPTTTTGMQIGPQGFYEPYFIPDNDIQILGSGAGTTGILLYATPIE